MSYTLVPYDCKVLADSRHYTRLTTVEVTYPRFIHAEMLRHRVQSHCVASSRALPPEDVIAQVEDEPFVPETFNARVKGMGVGEVLDADATKRARTHWLAASKAAVMAAKALIKTGVDKSRINRVLEPYMYVVDVITATEWENFYALRSPDGLEPTIDFPAQLEFQKTALEIKRVMQASPPQKLLKNWWHLPKLTEAELTLVCDARSEQEEGRMEMGKFLEIMNMWCMISARRVAATSFLKDAMQESTAVSVDKAEKLAGSAHWSPFEHIARPMQASDLGINGVTIPAHFTHDLWYRNVEPSDVVPHAWAGNFRGWFQYRHVFPNQDNHRKAMENMA